MSKIELLHGSNHVIEKPELHIGKKNNDYGQGFYCTKELAMAMEWACKENTDGFVNKYTFEQTSLNVLNLLDGEYTILHWMALLLKNRTFRLSNEIALDARAYIIDNFGIDLKMYDVVMGYRADDSYFSFAESFVQNGLSLRSLKRVQNLEHPKISYIYKYELGKSTPIRVIKEISFEDAQMYRALQYENNPNIIKIIDVARIGEKTIVEMEYGGRTAGGPENVDEYPRCKNRKI